MVFSVWFSILESFSIESARVAPVFTVDFSTGQVPKSQPRRRVGFWSGERPLIYKQLLKFVTVLPSCCYLHFF